MSVVIFSPLLVVIGKSFSTPTGWGWQWYVDIFSQRKGSTAFVSPTDAMINSFLYGLVTVLLAVVVGALAASTLARARHGFWQGLADVVVSLPLGTSAVTVGFGYILVFSTSGFDLRQSFWIVPIAHSVIAMPLVVRIVLPSMKRRDMAIDDAAKVLGATWWQKLRHVDLPLLRQPLTVAAAFAFAVSLGEFGATAFLARPDRPTLPIAIYRTLGRPGESTFGQAMALSVILMVFLAVAVAVIARNAKSSDSSFL
jgi:thiamine transport system permease protein